MDTFSTLNFAYDSHKLTSVSSAQRPFYNNQSILNEDTSAWTIKLLIERILAV